MLIYIAGILTGILLSFGARLADKDITKIVERYGKSGSVVQGKPMVVKPSEPAQSPDEFLRELNRSV